MARTKFNHAYRNNNDLIAFDEFADQIQALPRAKIAPLYYDNETASKFKAVVSEDGNIEYNAVTDSYSLVQHQDVMFQVLNTIQAAGIDGNARIKAFGGKCYMDMVFSNMRINDPSGTDISIGYTARNTYDGSGGINLFPFAIRGICSNGMIFKMTPDLGLNTISIKHMGDIEEKVRFGMKNLIEHTMRIEGVFIEMIDKATRNIIEFSGNELELTMSEYTGSRLSARKVIESSGLQLTGEISQWQIYNALTQYASWNISNSAEYERIEAGAEKLLQSNTQSMKQALETAIKTEETRVARREARRAQLQVTMPLTT